MDCSSFIPVAASAVWTRALECVFPHFLSTGPSLTFHKPLGPYALEQQPGSPQGPGDPVGPGRRSITLIREGNYTHNLFNGPQVQQRREAHKDPDQGGLLPHRREQEVQEHSGEFSSFYFESSALLFHK